MNRCAMARRYCLWGVVILSPILAGIVLGWMTGTSVFRYEAWNSSLDDEMGCWRTISVMRESGLSTGMDSYNEVLTDYPSYGADDHITYGPLFLASTVMDWAGHNVLVYINVLIMVFAYGVVVFALRPSVVESICLVLLILLNAFMTRITWSSMNEASAGFLSIVAVSLSLWLVKNSEGEKPKKEALGWTLLLLTVFFLGLMRPYLLAFFLLPGLFAVSICKSLKSAALRLALTIFGAAFVLFVALWIPQNHSVSIPEYDSFRRIYFSVANKGVLSKFIYVVGLRNAEAIRFLLQQMNDMSWVGFVTAETVVIWLILGFHAVFHWREDRRNACLSIAFLVVCFLIYESIITIYGCGKLHRMLFPVLCASSIYLSFIHPKGRQTAAWIQITIICVFSLSAIASGKTNSIRYPQKMGTEPEENKLIGFFSEAIPISTEDVWKNSIAVYDQDIDYPCYCIPTNLGVSVCTKDYLKTAIANCSIKSYYVLIDNHEEELTAQCVAAGYIPICANRGFTVYQVIRPPTQIKATMETDRAVSLRLSGDTREFGWETCYAWRVFRNGEHLVEYDCTFTANVDYDIILKQDGIYKFELFFQTTSESDDKLLVSDDLIVSHEIDILRAGNNTVMLNYVGPVKSENVNYAWYVYRGKTQIDDKGRDYQSNAEHLVTLEEDGIYTFKCFCMVSKDRRSVLSFPVKVSGGSIVDDPRLGEISIEEAHSLAFPPLQADAKATEDRLVKLTVLDDSIYDKKSTEFAWRVCRNGVHTVEYDRAFTQEPQYDVYLAEDGIYSFELLYRRGSGGEVISAMSKEIAITHEIDILRAGNNTVMLNYVGPVKGENVNYAWYVYRGKERIDEKSRDYQSNAEHLVALEEDGVYTFKCFCMASKDKRSVLSFPVTVENGSILDDPRLGEINMEEAVNKSR